MPNLKRIKIKRVSRVALCEAGANLVRGLYKSATGDELTITPLAKSTMTEEGLLYTIVYAPHMVDDHSMFMGTEDIKKSCHSYAVSGMALDINHGSTALAKSAAMVVENTILQSQDNRFPLVDNKGRTINHVGAWAIVTALFDEELRKQAREGTLAEVSLFAAAGDYSLEDVKDDELPPELKKSTEDEAMKPEELKALFEAQTLALSKAITDAIALSKSTEKPKDEKKAFDPTDTEALSKMAFNAGLNDIYESFDIDRTNVEEGVASLNREDLAKFKEAVHELKVECGLAKAKREVRQERKEERTLSTNPTFEEAFGSEPLTKAKAIRERLSTSGVIAKRS